MGLTSDRSRLAGIDRGPQLARIAASVVFFGVLGLLISHQTSTWRRFDWTLFYNNVRYSERWRSVGAVAAMYSSYLLRAVRWKGFLRPVKESTVGRLLGPTIIGFGGLALLGRPGELIRPLLIASKEELSIASQIAILALERVFDMMSAAVLVVPAILVLSQSQGLPYLAQLQRGGVLLLALMAIVGTLALILTNREQRLRFLLQRIFSFLPERVAYRVTQFVIQFTVTLKMIPNMKSFAQILALSISIWFLIALAFFQTIHAFSGLQSISFLQIFLLLGFSLLGSIAQLPGGGSQQLIFIATLVSVFKVSPELAVSCSILGWITIYMAPVPIGLVLLRRERSSLRFLFHWNRQPAA